MRHDGRWESGQSTGPRGGRARHRSGPDFKDNIVELGTRAKAKPSERHLDSHT